jgi:opacity protein-like surface antigen
MMKLHNVLLACAMGAGSLLAVAAPASAAHVVVATGRPAAVGYRAYGYPYRYGYRYGYGYPYRYGYGYPYRYGYGYGYPYGVGFGVNVGVGYGYPYGVGVGYGYAPYPAVYGRRYWGYRPYWRPYRRVYRVY